MTSYQHILLDWDGNIAKTLDVWLHVIRIALEKRGYELSDHEIAFRCFTSFDKAFTELGVTDIPTMIEEIDAMVAKSLPNVELYPDALLVLEQLRDSGKQTALITSSWRKNLLLTLDNYNMRHFFDIIIAGDDVTHHKPHPESLERALAELGGSKESAVMIGDSDKDLGAAKNAGVDSILFYPDEHQRFYKLDDLAAHKPTHTVSDFRKIIDIVN